MKKNRVFILIILCFILKVGLSQIKIDVINATFVSKERLITQDSNDVLIYTIKETRIPYTYYIETRIQNYNNDSILIILDSFFLNIGLEKISLKCCNIDSKQLFLPPNSIKDLIYFVNVITPLCITPNFYIRESLLNNFIEYEFYLNRNSTLHYMFMIANTKFINTVPIDKFNMISRYHHKETFLNEIDLKCNPVRKTGG